eukprot:2287342-Rhodomonas_salina.2
MVEGAFDARASPPVINNTVLPASLQARSPYALSPLSGSTPASSSQRNGYQPSQPELARGHASRQLSQNRSAAVRGPKR